MTHTAEDFVPGESVRYIPFHADGDARHKDCENGVVSSQNGTNVFVKYYRNGLLQSTAQATSPETLIKT